MSKHNTMTSHLSEVLAQQQHNLQQLQNLQQRAKSLTSNEYPGNTNYMPQSPGIRQQQVYDQQPQVPLQSQPYPMDGLTSGSPAADTLTTQGGRTNSMSTYQNAANIVAPVGIQASSGSAQGQFMQQAPAQGQAPIQAHLRQQQTPVNGQETAVQQPQAAMPGSNRAAMQGRNSLTNASSVSRARTSMNRNNANAQQDPRSPLVILMPTNAQPTEVLANRFAAWRTVIRAIITYLTETASIQDEIVRQQLRLTHAVQFPFFATENQHQPSAPEDRSIQKFFLPLGNGSIQDLPTILNQYHGSLASHASRTSKELTNEVIPRLEDLRRDLLVKMKEIKSLQSDFKNSCSKELQQTKQDLRNFLESIEEAKYGTAKQDPYLTKIILDRQIKKQLTEENFVHEAFDNLENSGAELEKVVVMEIQNALTIYARLLGEEAQLVFDCLLSKMEVGFFSKDPQLEWENFILRDPNFIVPNLPMRKMKEIVYKNQNDPLTYEIRSGVLERRSKFLKSYSRGYYVLTPTFLHEFKTADRKKDIVPVMSLSLNECSVTEHSKKGSSDDRFILHAKQNGLIHRGHNWVFRADNYETMMAWFEDLKIFASIGNAQEKAKAVIERLGLQVDSKGQPNSKLSSSPNPARPSMSQPPQDQQRVSMDVQSNNMDILTHNNIPSSTPRLDNQTNTITTSSIPDTRDFEIDNSIPNIYIDIPANEAKNKR
ncbi:hypothetical protein HG536_0B03260 [Torulaspora globosa]|uniref:PH domain-containing protein n=1 Tax=Torulaspora globosa TaxID=48254 RepID=A0A7G3ZD77_9SACH|nr:uncharacterized protein HG536_0B03260 [Torulaspora globosa]QLL31463.1 hypothetical protein HG536_0B03260 [Torulaspora globosa]